VEVQIELSPAPTTVKAPTRCSCQTTSGDLCRDLVPRTDILLWADSPCPEPLLPVGISIPGGPGVDKGLIAGPYTTSSQNPNATKLQVRVPELGQDSPECTIKPWPHLPCERQEREGWALSLAK
jgi:hypothetical protein